ncbi:hypothetical protein J3R30DRAFT_31139 [Lentinula aciculospora]|uniref:Uncharacterized protein n=1 Tax=Lentinula aciculospora TaxID=153920 RepID=A0A9W9AVR7_9AGAR|nr:hypothetical protein J3R30DRAFT_31139 [Lentinula aciculospora]
MSSSFPPTCIITENPDIAGIGVRLSIYLPAILVTLNSGFVTGKVFVDLFTGELFKYLPPPLLKPSLDDQNFASGSDIELDNLEAATHPVRSSSTARSAPSSTYSIPSWNTDNKERRMFRGYLNYLSDHPHYFESAKSLERSLFLIGSAIIVSALLDATFVTAPGVGLPPYHALLVLNLSLLNHLAGSSFFLFRMGSIMATVELRDTDEDDGNEPGIMSKTIWLAVGFFDVFGPSMLQTIVIIAFGIWFWVSTTFYYSFSGYSMTVNTLLSSTSYNSTIAASPAGPSTPSQCVSNTLYWAFHGIPIESNLSIQIISFIFYIGTALVPFLGPATPIVTIIPTVIMFRSVPLLLGLLFSGVIYLFGIVLPRITTRLVYFILPKLYHLSITLSYPHPTQSFFPTRLSPSAISTKLIFSAMMLTNLCTVVFLIISTEKIIFINSASQSGTVVIDGAQWTYGQTLALLSAIIGVFMYIAEVVGHWREAWHERRKRLQENNNDSAAVENANGEAGDSGDKDASRSQEAAHASFSWTDTRRSIFNMKKRASSI